MKRLRGHHPSVRLIPKPAPDRQREGPIEVQAEIIRKAQEKRARRAKRKNP